MKDYISLYLGVGIALMLIFTVPMVNSGDTKDDFYRLQIADEDRCSRYDKKNGYPYSQTLEQFIVDRFAEDTGIYGCNYGPYEDECHKHLTGRDGTQIEHIVATSEAHDSGMCAYDSETKAAFASDMDNLTLASGPVNRDKGGKDPYEWLPENNVCWYIGRWIAVKKKYDLSVDLHEAVAIERVIKKCEHYEYVIGE